MLKFYFTKLRFLYFILITILLAGVIVVSIILFSPNKFADNNIIYVYSPGTNTHQLADELYQRGVIKHPLLFRIAIRVQGHSKHLKSGEYEFNSGISMQGVINKLASGDVSTYEVTIVDGWTFKQALQMLESNPYLKHTLKGMSVAEIAKKLGIQRNNPEGLFLPETYQFIWPDSDEDVLRRAHKALQLVLQAQWEARTTGLVYKTPYQALIVASLVQKESGDVAERTEISGVIYRRLLKNMRLQIDPTVIYALGNKYKGKLHREDLWVKSPYNTYRHRGLPPTPIALPGANAIHAALHPDDGDALYFVAKGDGSHHFSSTLKAHDKAVLKYLLDKKTN